MEILFSKSLLIKKDERGFLVYGTILKSIISLSYLLMRNLGLKQFQSEYAGCLESEIIGGQSSKFGYTFPNKILGNGSFVLLNNGDEVDMTHFMVVGRRGEFMGVINEITQIGTSSFFYGQDLYSNKLGVNFFTRYDEVIKQNPIRISEYIYWFLSNPENTKH